MIAQKDYRLEKKHKKLTFDIDARGIYPVTSKETNKVVAYSVDLGSEKSGNEYAKIGTVTLPSFCVAPKITTQKVFNVILPAMSFSKDSEGEDIEDIEQQTPAKWSTFNVSVKNDDGDGYHDKSITRAQLIFFLIKKEKELIFSQTKQQAANEPNQLDVTKTKTKTI